MSYTITESVRLETMVCCVCGITFAFPEHRINYSREHPDKEFYCPNGHNLVYKKNSLKEEIEQLKKERDEANRARMVIHNMLTAKETEIKKLKTKIKSNSKRIAAGVCPCCGRTFKQLADHMKTKHPEFVNAKEPNPMHTKINSK